MQEGKLIIFVGHRTWGISFDPGCWTRVYQLAFCRMRTTGPNTYIVVTSIISITFFIWGTTNLDIVHFALLSMLWLVDKGSAHFIRFGLNKSYNIITVFGSLLSSDGQGFGNPLGVRGRGGCGYRCRLQSSNLLTCDYTHGDLWATYSVVTACCYTQQTFLHVVKKHNEATHINSH